MRREKEIEMMLLNISNKLLDILGFDSLIFILVLGRSKVWWGDEFVGRKSRRVWEGGGRRFEG